MTITEWLMFATLVVSSVSVLILPFILRGLTRGDGERAALKNEIHNRLDHLDACLHNVRERVVGETVTRADFAALEARIEGTINRVRAAISSDTSGLHDRLFRLENILFRVRPDE